MTRLAVLLSLLLPLAGAELRLVDDVGRTVVVRPPVRRIVSTAPSHTELLFALDAGDRVVGVTSHCSAPAEACRLPKVGDFGSLDMEKILELEPDLVVASWLAQKRGVLELERRGLTVLVLYPDSLDAVMDSIRTLGRAVGRETRAEKLVRSMGERLDAVRRRVAERSGSERPRVFVAVTMSPLFTAGPGSTLHELIERAGGVNVFADLDKPYAPVTAEAVLARDPEVILLAHEVERGEGRAIVAALPGLAATSATREGRVVDWIDPNLLVHPNHHLVDGLEALERALAGERPDS
jgi:iron complex transport system substrate-binding protein